MGCFLASHSKSLSTFLDRTQGSEALSPTPAGYREGTGADPPRSHPSNLYFSTLHAQHPGQHKHKLNDDVRGPWERGRSEIPEILPGIQEWEVVTIDFQLGLRTPSLLGYPVRSAGADRSFWS